MTTQDPGKPAYAETCARLGDALTFLFYVALLKDEGKTTTDQGERLPAVAELLQFVGIIDRTERAVRDARVIECIRMQTW